MRELAWCVVRGQGCPYNWHVTCIALCALCVCALLAMHNIHYRGVLSLYNRNGTLMRAFHHEKPPQSVYRRTEVIKTSVPVTEPGHDEERRVDLSQVAAPHCCIWWWAPGRDALRSQPQHALYVVSRSLLPALFVTAPQWATLWESTSSLPAWPSARLWTCNVMR